MARRTRKGNHPSNPYAGEAETAPRLEDREGWPFAAQRHKADLSDDAQLGGPPPPPPAAAASPEGAEPTFVLRASDRLSGMLVRAWANMAAELGLAAADDLQHARMMALQMDEWRRKHGGGR